MAAHKVVNKYFSGQGVLMLAERDAVTGAPLGFTTVGNVSDLKISIDQTTFEHKEATSGSRGVDYEVVQENNVSVDATLESLDRANLGLSLWGSATAIPAATAHPETVTALLGKIVPLSYLKLANFTMQDVTDTTSYVEGKNYDINLEAGSIYFYTAAEQTAAGAANVIADKDVIHTTYDFGDQDEIEAMVTGRPERYLRFEGLNTADSNEPAVIEIFRVGTKPLAELAMINEELGQAVLSGKAYVDDTRVTGSKYFRIRKTGG